jgi:hypothetical protein
MLAAANTAFAKAWLKSYLSTANHYPTKKQKCSNIISIAMPSQMLLTLCTIKKLHYGT